MEYPISAEPHALWLVSVSHARGAKTMTSKGRRALLRSRLNSLFAVAALACATSMMSPIQAGAQQTADASAVLKRMTDYIAAHPDLSSRFDIEFDSVTPEIEKVQFAASGTLTRNGSNRVHLTRHGAYSDVELVFDGKTTTIVDRYRNKYAQLTGPISIVELVRLARPCRKR